MKIMEQASRYPLKVSSVSDSRTTVGSGRPPQTKCQTAPCATDCTTCGHRATMLAERIWPPPAAGCLAHGRQARVSGDPVSGRPAHRRPGGGHRHGVGLTVIGHMAAGHGSPPF